MADRPVYVYRLHVTPPPESLAPGWEPPGWHNGHDWCPPEEECVFRWPSKRHCMSSGTASRWARQLKEYGATVRVERSEPVRWPS